MFHAGLFIKPSVTKLQITEDRSCLCSLFTWNTIVMRKKIHFRNTTTTDNKNSQVFHMLSWMKNLNLLIKTSSAMRKLQWKHWFSCCISCAPCINSQSQTLHGAHFKPLTPSFCLFSCSWFSVSLCSVSLLHCPFFLVSLLSISFSLVYCT